MNNLSLAIKLMFLKHSIFKLKNNFIGAETLLAANNMGLLFHNDLQKTLMYLRILLRFFINHCKIRSLSIFTNSYVDIWVLSKQNP